MLKDVYCQKFKEESDEIGRAIIECAFLMRKTLLFQKVIKVKPEEVTKALREEIIRAIKIDIWHPVHMNKLSKEEKELIPQMMNHFEKYKPDVAFDKFKVTVLARGDKQVYTGESEGPVA